MTSKHPNLATTDSTTLLVGEGGESASESPQWPRQTKASIRQDSFVSNVEKKNQAIVDEDKGEEAKANVGSRTKSKKRKNAEHEVTVQISKKKKVDCDKHTVRKGLMNKDEGVDNCLVNEETSVKNVNERGKEMGQVKLKRNTSCLTLIIRVLDPYMESILNVFKVDSHRVYDMLRIPMGGIPFLSLEEILGGRVPFAIDWFAQFGEMKIEKISATHILLKRL
ncbi:hypothetical protein Tco_0825115 [Tanacetum coccineum]